MTHLEQIDSVIVALMFHESRAKDGRLVRTVALTPDVVEAMSIRDAARYFESPDAFGADAAVRSARARERGESVTPVAVSLSAEKRAQLAGA